jgi:hypothetical protein
MHIFEQIRRQAPTPTPPHCVGAFLINENERPRALIFIDKKYLFTHPILAGVIVEETPEKAGGVA